MAGRGTYAWVDLAGDLRFGHHWDDLPARMQTLVRFEPEIPPEPHSDQDHALITRFEPKLKEALSRCLR